MVHDSHSPLDWIDGVFILFLVLLPGQLKTRTQAALPGTDGHADRAAHVLRGQPARLRAGQAEAGRVIGTLKLGVGTVAPSSRWVVGGA